MLAGMPARKPHRRVVCAVGTFARMKRRRLRQRVTGSTALQNLHHLADDVGNLRNGDLRVHERKVGQQLVKRWVGERLAGKPSQEKIILQQQLDLLQIETM